MTFRLFANPTEAAVNARAGQPVNANDIREVDVLDTELAAAIDAGLAVLESANAQKQMAGAANGRTLVRSKVEGAPGRDIRVGYVVAGNNTPRTIVVSGKDVTVNVATDGGGAVAGTETGTAIAAALNADAGASGLIEAQVLAGDTGAGLVAATAIAALTGGNGTDARRKAVSSVIEHALTPTGA